MSVLTGALFALAVALTVSSANEIECYQECMTVSTFTYGGVDTMAYIPAEDKACAKGQVVKCAEGEVCGTFDLQVSAQMTVITGGDASDAVMDMTFTNCVAKTDLTGDMQATFCAPTKIGVIAEFDLKTVETDQFAMTGTDVTCDNFDTCELDCVEEEHSGAASLSVSMMVLVLGVISLFGC